ncbi:hypothetical protein ACTFIZ_007309 [Dictyostelium cf. discoideum]
MFQTGGLFGQTSNTTGGGLFGSSTAATPSTGGGLFGSSTAATPSTGGGLFGSSTAATPTSTGCGGGLFGSSTSVAPTSTGGGLFGSSTSVAPTSTGGGGLFGGVASSIGPQGGGGLFGGTTLPSTSGSGLFNGQSSIGFSSTGGGGGGGGGGNGLFGTTSVQQQAPQQPLITESTKFSDLPPQLKNELQILNKMIINNNSLMNSFSNYDTKINEISIGLDQVASVMDNLFNNFDIHIQSFKYLEESLAKPLNSVNEQVHLLSTQFHSPFSQARPSKEMEIIVDSLVEKIDRIKQTILCVTPTNKSQSQNLSFQESFISTLQSNQIILRNLAYIVDNLVTELERHKKHFLLYKKKYYNQNYNPFLKQPKLNEKTDYHGSSLHHSHFSQSSNLLSSQSSLFGSSIYGRQSQQQQNPQQSQYLQSSTFQPIQTSTSFFNPTSTTTSFGLTNNNNNNNNNNNINNNSLASNNNNNSSSSSISSSGSSLGSLGSGSGLFGSTATNNSLGSTSSSGSTSGSTSGSIVIPPLAIGSITNNSGGGGGGGGLFGSSNSSSNSLNSLSTSSSNLFGPPQTPTLSGQGSTLGSGGFSISASASNLDTPNRKKNSLNSSKR